MELFKTVYQSQCLQKYLHNSAMQNEYIYKRNKHFYFLLSGVEGIGVHLIYHGYILFLSKSKL